MKRSLGTGLAPVLRVVVFAALIGIAALTALTRLGPLLGYEVFVIRGASMEPGIPLGSLVVASRTDPRDLALGDIVSFRTSSGKVVTHRILGITEDAGERLVSTGGDASDAPDPTPVPHGAIVGVVRVHLPILGYLLAMLAQPMGMLSLLSGLAALWLALLLVEAEESKELVRKPDARLDGLPA